MKQITAKTPNGSLYKHLKNGLKMSFELKNKGIRRNVQRVAYCLLLLFYAIFCCLFPHFWNLGKQMGKQSLLSRCLTSKIYEI